MRVFDEWESFPTRLLSDRVSADTSRVKAPIGHLNIRNPWFY